MVSKKAGKYRLINAAQRLNAVTITDASLPPSADDFSEEFAGFPLLSLLDLFSGYDQCILVPESRDMTPFRTPFGLVRMTTLPQGYTNGVQVFHRVIRKVLKDVISENRGKPFIHDIAVKRKTKSYVRDSDGISEEVAPGIRRFVLEAIISLDNNPCTHISWILHTSHWIIMHLGKFIPYARLFVTAIFNLCNNNIY